MSSIKPTDAKPAGSAATGSGVESGGGADAAGAAFRKVLEGAEGVAAPEVSAGVGVAEAAGGAQGASVESLAEAVRSGAITAEQAIDALVEQSIEGLGGVLGPEERGEIGALLRQALQDDPALAALRDAVDVGR
ncbi:MAG: hypothetical protein OEZ06_15705 [Myxococcales bacterium]|nr:hypothetical protein [Myxococcales bacterium]